MSKLGRVFYLFLMVTILALSACGKGPENAPVSPDPSVEAEVPEGTGEDVDSGSQSVTGESALPEAVVEVRTEAEDVKVGDTIQVSIDVANVQDLAGIELHLIFDSALLEVVDADTEDEGIQIEHGGLVTPDFVALNEVDLTNGSIDYAIVQLPPTPAVAGDGTLAKITFRGKGTGEATTTLDQVLLATLDGESIPTSLQNSVLTITMVN